MFWKRKPAEPKPPAGSGDRELDGLRAALAARQERVAQLELDLLNSQNELAAFNAEIEQRLGPLQRRMESLEAELSEARRRASASSASNDSMRRWSGPRRRSISALNAASSFCELSRSSSSCATRSWRAASAARSPSSSRSPLPAGGLGSAGLRFQNMRHLHCGRAG